MSVNPSQLVSVGLGVEAVYGTAVTPSLLLPVTTPTPQDDLVPLFDDGWRVAPAAAFGAVVGTTASRLLLAGPVYPDGVGFPLAGILGDVTFTAGSPNQWVMALQNSGAQQPPSYTAVVNDPTGQVSFAGCRFTTVDVKYDAAAAMTWQGQMLGLAGAPSAWSMPAVSSELQVASWRSTVMIGGVVEAQTLTAQVKLDRAVLAKRNVDGSVTPYLQRADVLKVTGDLTVAASTDTYRQNALAGVLTSLDIAFTAGAGSALRALTLHCSRVLLTAVRRQYGTRWIELAVQFEALANTTDVGASGGWSPIKATLQNAVPSGTYA